MGVYLGEPPINHIYLTSLESTFPHILTHNFHFSLFAVRTIEQGESSAHPMRALHYPTCPPQRHCVPPHLQPTPRQGNLRTAPRHFASPNADGGTSPLHCMKYFLFALTPFFLCYCRGLPRSYHPLRGGDFIDVLPLVRMRPCHNWCR